MFGKAHVLAAFACCAFGICGCAAPAGEKANWNFFSAWKVDTRDKKAGATSDAPTTAALAQQQSAALCLATAGDLEREGHLREAAVLVEKARQMNPQAAELTPRLAKLYEQLHDVPQARAEYRQALAAAPQNADLWNTYGYFEFRERQFSAAEDAFRRTLALSPEHALAQLNLAQTLANAGRLNEAYEQFAGIQGAAGAHASVGAVLEGQGRWDEARAAFDQALSVNPQEPAALAFLERLGGPASAVAPASANLPISGATTLAR